MANFKLDEYEPVENRVRAFWETYPEGAIQTELTVRERADGKTEWIARAEMFRNLTDVAPAATGYATEIEGSSPVNRTNASENAETSAIGRAAANLGFAPKGKRPSREEMQKVERANAAPIIDDWQARVDALKTKQEARVLFAEARKAKLEDVQKLITLKQEGLPE